MNKTEKYNPTRTKNELFDDTEYYRNKYRLYEDENYNRGWNDKKDAFRHAYSRAYTTYSRGEVYSNAGMTYHEIDGNLHGQDPKEENMDKWNNQVGKEIGDEVKNMVRGMENMFNDQSIKDYIADMVMQRMRAGDLITNPNDSRKFSDYNKIKARKEELVPKVIQNRYSATVPIEHLKNKKGFYKGFINEENGTDRIYSVENVGSMSDDEYKNTKKVLQAQIRKIGLPSNHELKRASSGGEVYVHSYTRGDGTHVTDYYRSYPNR